MASTVEMRVRLLLQEESAHTVLYAVAEFMRERAGHLEQNKLADATMRVHAADYRSVAMHVSTAANLADDLLR